MPRCLRTLALHLAAMIGASTVGLAEEGWKLGPDVALSKGSFRLTLTGYLQGDFRYFSKWEVAETEAEGLRRDEGELRRSRVGLDLVWSRLNLQAQVDPHEEGRSVLKDAYAELRFGKSFRLRGGHFKVPVSPEFLTSAAKTDFVERAMLVNDLGPSRDFGVMAHGEVNRLRYQVGVFAGDGWSQNSRAGTTTAAHLTVTLAKGLDLGASASLGEVTADAVVPGASLKPRGLKGESATGYEFFVPHFVDGRRTRLDAEATISWGPVTLKAEALLAREQRKGQSSALTDMPDIQGQGWAASALWVLRGQKKRQPGALEMGARYESLRFEDSGQDAGFQGFGNRARNVKPVSAQAATAGLSFWLTRWGRIMGDVVVERYGEPLVAPEPGRRGNYVTLLGRVQLHLP
jgi:phosphate-selective porin